ncbi:hypothetical protein R5R35_011299 [Gryllus longicercus]|uniref:Uncharacterized protein n=1 Tax=Gryllus longicercus TaxID=2509291 RepID=A0AAN9W030_9ORTH
MDKQSKPFRNIANVLGRTGVAKRLGKTEDAVSACPPEIQKFEKGTSVTLCPHMENEGPSIDVLPAKVGSVGAGNDFENFGHSQMYRPKNEDSRVLAGFGRSHDVTLPNVTSDVQGLTAQDFAQNIGTVNKFEEDAPTPSNNTKCEEGSSLGITVNIASVETRKEAKSTVNCVYEIDKINFNCDSPTPLTVLGLDDVMPAGQGISGKFSLDNCVSEKEPLPEQFGADSSLKNCKMEAGFCENLFLQDVEANENKPINGCFKILTSDEDRILNNVEDSNECVLYSNLHTKVESIITVVEVGDSSNSRTTGMHLKTQKISYDSPPDENERTNYDVPCPSTVSDIGNELLAPNCPEQKTAECDRRAEIKNEILAECEAEVTSLKTQCEFSDEQNFRSKAQELIDFPNDKNAVTHSNVSCPPTVSDFGNDLSAMNCPELKTVECDRQADIKNEILAEITSSKTQCELSDEQNFNTEEKKDTVLSSKTDCLEDINQIKFTDLGTLVLENVRNHDTTINEAKNNEKFKSFLSERDDLSPWEWKRLDKSSTPCQVFSKIIQDDEGPKACQILSTPKAKRNVNIDTTKGKKIDFTEIGEVQNNDYFVENIENQLEKATVYNKTENVKTVLNIKQEQENPVKLSENVSDNKSMQMKRPASPESQGIKKVKFYSNKSTIIDVIDVEAENEVQLQMKVDQNPLKVSENVSDNKSMQMKRPASPDSQGFKKAKFYSNESTIIDVIDVEAENEVQLQMKVDQNPLKVSETLSDASQSVQMKRPESQGIKEAKFYSNKSSIIDVEAQNDVQKQIKVGKITKNAKFTNTNFVSKDPQENEDNNNPEWEVLKKLETDDERYKAVRKRWRNLVIPDPNKNLTCIHKKSSFKHPNLCTRGGDKVSDKNAKRKRTHSHEPTTSTDHVPVKRARTRSCTTSYELKVKDCYKRMEEESRKLIEEKRHALANTSNYYYRQYSNLMASNLRYYNNWEFQIRIAALSAEEKRAEEAVHQDYSGAFDRLENKKRQQALVFENAMKEVEAFHKFYRKLEDSSKNDCFFLTDVELDDVKATDELYERFNTFYS